jgi:hypothetical protein
MLNAKEARDILRSLATLPDDKVAEVRDFVAFLRERYAEEVPVERGDEWTEEDLHDLTAAVLDSAGQTLWGEGLPDAPAR